MSNAYGRTYNCDAGDRSFTLTGKTTKAPISRLLTCSRFSIRLSKEGWWERSEHRTSKLLYNKNIDWRFANCTRK